MTLRILAAAALAATLAATHAVAQLPRSDTTFAGAGQLNLPWTSSNLDRDAIAPGPQNQIFMGTEEVGSLRLLKLDSSGVPVSDYAGGGISRLTVDTPFDLASVAPQSDGSVLLGGRRDVMRADPLGRIDRSFGDQGRIRVPFINNGDCAAARVRWIFPHAGGWIVVATNFYVDTTNPVVPLERACAFVARLKADGNPDLAFAANSNLILDSFQAFDVVMKDGYLEILGRRAQVQAASIQRVGLDGRLIESFGSFGSLELPHGGAPARMADGRLLPDGSVILVGSRDSASLTLYRYKADRTADTSFAGLGRSVILIRNQDPSAFDVYASRILAVVDGGFLVRVRVTETSPALSRNEDFYKVDALGLPDARFGDAGYARHRSKGDSRVLAWMIQPDGYAVYSAASFSPLPTPGTGLPPGPPSYVTVAPFLTRIQAVPDIVEFRNTITNHYFIAYDGLEASGIDAGAAGPGWIRTGQTFRAGGTVAVCRFYNGRSNTHFFTIDATECENVKRLPGYFYEGLGFFLTPPVKGECPSPLRPLHRLFNNHVNDPNHRYITDLSLAPEMVAQGWTLEGVAFCAKP